MSTPRTNFQVTLPTGETLNIKHIPVGIKAIDFLNRISTIPELSNIKIPLRVVSNGNILNENDPIPNGDVSIILEERKNHTFFYCLLLFSFFASIIIFYFKISHSPWKVISFSAAALFLYSIISYLIIHPDFKQMKAFRFHYRQLNGVIDFIVLFISSLSPNFEFTDVLIHPED